jgi:uncharacterized protein YigE (DUF2233 family)
MSLGGLKTYGVKHALELLFATNAGMYTRDNSPKGLYVEKGKELVPIDLKMNKPGNFYLQPNGCFHTH